MRETTKQVKHEVDGKEMTFQIRKMDALRGATLAKFATEKIVPLFAQLKDLFAPIPEGEKAEDVIAERMESITSIIPEALKNISDDELIALETKCLRTVDALLPAGWHPVMIGDKFGVQEVETDIVTALLLTYDVIEFNMGSFFQGNSLTSFLNRLNTSK